MGGFVIIPQITTNGWMSASQYLLVNFRDLFLNVISMDSINGLKINS